MKVYFLFIIILIILKPNFNACFLHLHQTKFHLTLKFDKFFHQLLIINTLLIYSKFFFFFFISKESGQASGDNIDIPTMLAPKETSILCRQTQENKYKGGETRPKPSKEKTENKSKENNIKNTLQQIMEI